MVVARHRAYHLVDGSLRHGFVGTVAGVQMITAVETVGKRPGIGVATNGSIKIDTSVKNGRRAQPLVEGLTHLLTLLVIGAPAIDRQQGAAPHLQSHGLGGLDIDILYPTLHLLYRRQVAPRTEGVDIDHSFRWGSV